MERHRSGPPVVPAAPQRPASPSGFRLLTVSGIPVFVAPSSLLVVAVVTWLNAPQVRDAHPGIGIGAYAIAASFVVLLYASVLLHELAHSLTAQRLGLTVRRIRLDLLGGFSETTPAPTAGREAVVAGVGPMVNLVLFGLGLAAVQVASSGSIARDLLVRLTIANLLVGAFNLLPGIPLDGGRVLAAGLWRATRSRERGIVFAAHAGRGLAVLVVLLVIGAGVLTGDAPSVLGIVVAVLVAGFLWQGATASLVTARAQLLLPGLVAGHLARPAHAFAASTPLAEVVRRAGAAGWGSGEIVVVDAEARPVGIVSRPAFDAVPEHRRPWVDVAAVAARLEPGHVLPSGLAGGELLAALRATPAGAYVVVHEPAGDGVPVVAGVLRTADVEAALAAGGRSRPRG